MAGFFKTAWHGNRDKIDALKTVAKSGEGGPLDFLVPIEVLIPSDTEDAIAMDAFTSSLFDICAARSNNKQLAD